VEYESSGEFKLLEEPDADMMDADLSDMGGHCVLFSPV